MLLLLNPKSGHKGLFTFCRQDFEQNIGNYKFLGAESGEKGALLQVSNPRTNSAPRSKISGVT